jgi:hypothetical protein
VNPSSYHHKPYTKSRPWVRAYLLNGVSFRKTQPDDSPGTGLYPNFDSMMGSTIIGLVVNIAWSASIVILSYMTPSPNDD